MFFWESYLPGFQYMRLRMALVLEVKAWRKGTAGRMMLHMSPTSRITVPCGVQHQEDACFMMWQAHSSSP